MGDAHITALGPGDWLFAIKPDTRISPVSASAGCPKLKTAARAACVLACSAMLAWSQPVPSATTKDLTEPPGDATRQIVERGPHHRVWAKVTWATNALGNITACTNQAYVELATGMHYRKDGRWVESREEIQILPRGGAAAVEGQHKAFFPSDIFHGLIEVETPDGQRLRSRPLGISYFDGSNSVLIAELKSSVGQLLPSGNQIIYPDAFTDFKADLVCTYRKGGIECDLVFREQPPGPEEWGLEPAAARLQLLTEFFGAPEPVKEIGAAARRDRLRDTTLHFGAMKMGPGRAFAAGISSRSAQAKGQRPTETETRQPEAIPVYKSWEQLEGRTFLIEEVPYHRIRPALKELSALNNATPTLASANRIRHQVSASRLLPPSHPILPDTGTIQLAQVDLNRQTGVVLDWEGLLRGSSNYTFRSDTTYLISGAVNLMGTTTIEGGAVVKYSIGAKLSVDKLECKTAPYRPAVFTARNDGSVGATLNWRGSLSGYAASTALEITCPGDSILEHVRIAYAATGVRYPATAQGGVATVRHVQILRCGTGIDLESGSAPRTLNFGNGLVSAVERAFRLVGAGGRIEHLTVDGCDTLAGDTEGGDNGLYVTNSVLANVTNLADHIVVEGSHNGFYNSPSFGSSQYPNDSWPFQSVGAGNYYLATGSSYRHAGSSGIDAGLRAQLRQTTTCPPIIVPADTTLSVDTTLGPPVARDTGVPDLGYHYDPIDYLTGGFTVTNCTLTLPTGTAIGFYTYGSGIKLLNGSGIVSVGSPLSQNWFVLYSSVQEQRLLLGCPDYFVWAIGRGSGAARGEYRFTQFACLADSPSTYFIGNPHSALLVQDCAFWNGSGGQLYSSAGTLKNNLFARCGLDTGRGLSLSNNLFLASSYEGPVTRSFTIESFGYAYNNLFDSCYLGPICSIANGNNAYIACTAPDGYLGRLYPTNASGDIVLTNFTYATGPLGYYYQASTNLLNQGSTTADSAGLYHGTTQTNQVKEANSIVDIGLHYVVVDANGDPLDADGDGLADHFEDQNGDGAYDLGDIADWNASDTDGDGISDGTEWLLGLDPRNGGTVSDTNDAIKFMVYTPLE